MRILAVGLILVLALGGVSVADEDPARLSRRGLTSVPAEGGGSGDDEGTDEPQPVEVVNFPEIQLVSGTVEVGNLPEVHTVVGTVTVSNIADIPVNEAVEVTNFPIVQDVTGTVEVGNFPDSQTVTGEVSIDNLPLDEEGWIEVSCNRGPHSEIIEFSPNATLSIGESYSSEPFDSADYEVVGVSAEVSGPTECMRIRLQWRMSVDQGFFAHTNKDARRGDRALSSESTSGEALFEFVQGTQGRVVVLQGCGSESLIVERIWVFLKP